MPYFKAFINCVLFYILVILADLLHQVPIFGSLRKVLSNLTIKCYYFRDLKPAIIITEFEAHEARANLLISKMPHVMSLRDRMIMFRKLISREKEAILSTPCNVITIDRTRIVEDGYRQLGALSVNALRSTIRVKFINQLGLEEMGIDQDGVFKEFLELTLKKVSFKFLKEENHF